MISQNIWLVAGITAAAAAAITGAVRWYALSGALLDVPNDRSSHSRPTPRGGGVGPVAAQIGMAAWLAWRGGDALPALLGALAAVTLVAVVGWIDDHRSLAVGPRLVAHVGAGALLAAFALATNPGPLPALVAAWWVLWAVATINVINFMDGIDGLIGSQIALFGAHLAWLSPSGSYAALFAGGLAGAALGFLAWNWSPARIFLGDVGSGALGALAVLAGLLAMAAARAEYAVAFAPLFPLFLDATVTLARRWARGERLSAAHRSHLYQRLANGGWGHARVAVLYLALAAVGALAARVEGAASTAARVGYVAAVVAVGWWLERRLGRAVAAAGSLDSRTSRGPR